MTYKTKTICTIGPACWDDDTLEKLIIRGMDIARFNFSHAKPEEFAKTADLIRSLAKKNNTEVKILMDLQGPRMRVGELPDKGITLEEGSEITFTTDPENTTDIYIKDPYLHEDIQPKHPIYLANGDLELFVLSKYGTEFKAQVVRGGQLYSKKGVNVPETVLTTRGLTDKDKKDVAFGVEYGVDMIAMSFVKDGNDMQELRKLVGNKDILLVSKIEIKIALSFLDEIIEASDLIMVARGDLGIEIPLEELPLIQKDIIKRTNIKHKPSIVATQMLMSMVNHHRPTRAEVSDVANAVFDGAEYVMLSDETAFGKFPVESLDYLVKTAAKVQEYLRKNK